MWTVFRVGVGFTVPAILGTPYVLGKIQYLKYVLQNSIQFEVSLNIFASNSLIVLLQFKNCDKTTKELEAKTFYHKKFNFHYTRFDQKETLLELFLHSNQSSF